MRFDTPIFFQTFGPKKYNADTGDYDNPDVTEVKRFASVTNSGVETLNLVYGEIRQGSLTLRLLNHYDDHFDRIRIGSKVYRADFSRKLRTKHVFVVSEVQ